jgi:hypothetical protein
LPRDPAAQHGIHTLGETRKYLQDFNRLEDETTTARQLYDGMLKIHPNRANPGSLWNAANIAKKPRQPT